MKMRGRNSGFTIVEILVVIVVIAILAGITIVVFNGVQQRAKTASILAAVDGWEKIIRMEATKTQWPADNGTYTCLGKSSADFPASDGFAAGECLQTQSGGTTGSFRTDGYYIGGALAINAIPSTWWSSDTTLLKGALPATAFTNSNGDTYRVRGVVMYEYVSTTGSKIINLYYGTQSGQCARGQLYTNDQSNNPLSGGLCSEAVFNESVAI